MSTKVRQTPPALVGFDFHETLGVGGMGRVEKAWQKSLQRWVAVKCIPAEPGQTEEFCQILMREALATSSLSHPNIVKVFDVATQGGDVFLILEWIDGESLSQLLRMGTMDLHDVLELVRQIVGALRHAHQRGIIHRDIKPSNILINEDGHVWVADFGIASVRRAELSAATCLRQPTLLHAGCAAYMAPERLTGSGECGPTEDVYSLSAVAYECLMGYPPQGVFPPAASGGRALPEIDAVLRRALARDPQERPPTIEAFWAELSEAVGPTRLTKNDAQEGKYSSNTAGVIPTLSRQWILWMWLGLGMFFFLFQTILIGAIPGEHFSFPVGPGHKEYDAALALTGLNALFLTIWSVLVFRSWRKCCQHPGAPSFWTLLLCYLPIIVGISAMVLLAVSD